MEASFKEQCISLREQDLTITEIMRITGGAKTSVYEHIRGMPLSEKRLQTHKEASGRRVLQFSLARKGKSKKQFKTFEKWTPDTVLLLAHLLFDGEIGRGRCVYNNRSAALLDRVEKLMNSIYSFEPKRYMDSVTGVVKLAYFNVALSNYLQIKSRELMVAVQTLPGEEQGAFLKAFFDDEGCMTFNLKSGKRQVRGYQKDTDVLVLVQKLLHNKGVISRVVPPNEVVISGKENLLKFQAEINFSAGVCVNGNRSNSVWKESIEKRELLQ
jgi:hypothetical protein